ncbi:MAG: sulfite exporter TauE/SafE family protein [Xanthomonadales bacterium]|nr:sulfite exporter TauE/SafE family protein [Xanthomonadales bacterium]
MNADLLLWLSVLIFLVAMLYASVGHAGASGYIAVMSLLSLSPEFIRPTALTLNILVASLGTWQFARAGHFSWRTFWPFAALAPLTAFVGGYLALPAQVFKVIIGGVLLFSAWQLLVRIHVEQAARLPRVPVALATGAALGLLSGLTGTGGGIFLTPLLLLMGWATPKTAAAVSALFILMNSTTGLIGNVVSTGRFPDFALPLLLAAGVGGLAGAHFGSHRASSRAIKALLAAVLVVAGIKLLLF